MSLFQSDSYAPMDMSGKTILVMGAEHPLGQFLAPYLSRLGARLVLATSDQTELAKIAALQDEAKHHVVPLESMQGDALAGWMKQLVGQVGRLDGVCLLSSRWGAPAHLAETSVLEKQRMSALALALVKGWRQKKVRAASSRLVFVLSLDGLQGKHQKESLEYGAIQSMTRALSLELAQETLCLNCVAVPDTLQSSTSLLGPGQWEDIAGVVAFLLADTGRWITGTTVVVDGGASVYGSPIVEEESS